MCENDGLSKMQAVHLVNMIIYNDACSECEHV